jgi:hypothetical protein
MSLWPSIKRDIQERFMNFETVNGSFIFIPWGAGFIYCGLYAPAFGYTYGMVSLGVVLIIWGLRKTLVNRIHQAIKIEQLVHNCKTARRIRNK